MQTAKNKLSTTIALIVIALLVLPLLAFGLGNNKGVNTSWHIAPHLLDNGGGSYKAESVILSSEGTVSQIYLYVGNVYNAPQDKIVINLVHSDSETTIKDNSSLSSSRKQFIIDVKKGEYLGWVKLDLNTTIYAKYLKFSTEQSFELFEIALLDEKGNQVMASCYGGIVWKNGKHGFVEANMGADTFALVSDEQKGVVSSKGVNSLSKEEIELAGAIDNLINFKGGYVSNRVSPLGVELISIGVLLFGNSPFGLRIVGFLFFVATLYLLFFVARKMFSQTKYAIVSVILYLLAGASLSLVTKAHPVTVAIFFLMASFNFALDFYNKAQDGKSLRLNAHYLVLSGLTFAIALNVWLLSLFILPALIVLCLIPAVKVIKNTRNEYKNAEGLEKEYAREKHLKTVRKFIINSVVAYLLTPVLLTVVSYGVAYPTYLSFYGKNFVLSIFENNARILSSQKGGLFFGWMVGLGSNSTVNAFGVTSAIFANRAFSVISVLSLIAIGVLYILNAKNKILSGNLIVALKENKGNYIAVLCAFLSTFILNVFLWGRNDYAQFVISLLFALLSVVLLYKLLASFVKKSYMKAITAVTLTVLVLFFVLQTPFIFNFDLPKDFTVIYNWLA